MTAAALARRGALAMALAAVALACSRAEAPQRVEVDEDPLRALREQETARRVATSFATLRPSHEAFGADPYAIRALPGGGFVGILRGRAAIVELDGALRERRRLPAPPSPTALAVSATGDVFVAGELGGAIARYRVGDRGLVAAGEIELPGVRAVRDLAVGPEGTLYVVEEERGRLLVIPTHGARAEETVGNGALRVLRTRHHLLVSCLLDHAVVILPVDADGRPVARPAGDSRAARITHDGPIWSMDAQENADGLLVVVGGVEDRALDRTGGFFGYIDSFVFAYRVAKGAATRVAAVNVSEHGVITPKALALDERAGVRVRVTGYGGERMATLTWPRDFRSPPAITTRALPPGTAALAREGDGDALVLANPLLDAWVGVSGAGARVVTVPDTTPRSDASKLGEALFFTSLMAPWNDSDGAHSRFTCETCHFEAYVDGRTHHTGRGDVHATTKPLVGLGNNRPHFSRALDPDMTTMVNNEFRVAGAASARDPWFAIEASEHPWLADLRVGAARFSAEALRGALMTFLAELTHRPNPAREGRAARWTDEERDGATAFRDRCEGCHAARLLSDEPATRVPFERWEERTLATDDGGGIVWASHEYRKTGVLPYVHDDGARTPSLRRLYKKRPYFTNGAARDLEDVLARVRVAGDGAVLHAGSGAALDASTRAALRAFLALL